MDTTNTSKGYYTPAQKKSILRWREDNKEKYNEYMNDYFKGYYQKNAEAFRKKRMAKYWYEKECKRLRNIDIF